MGGIPVEESFLKLVGVTHFFWRGFNEAETSFWEVGVQEDLRNHKSIEFGLSHMYVSVPVLYQRLPLRPACIKASCTHVWHLST